MQPPIVKYPFMTDYPYRYVYAVNVSTSDYSIQRTMPQRDLSSVV